MKQLQAYERGGDLDQLVECFADDAELHAFTGKREHTGKDGARRFWQEYLKPFEEIESTFGHVMIGGNAANCEWVGKGSLSGGGPVEYQGVSLLEFNDSGKITRFRTYYDSAAFLPEGAGVA